MIDIKALLPPSHVLIDAPCADRAALWRALAQPLLAEGILVDIEVFLRDLERREKQITTRVTERVALPHARSNAARRLGIAVAILPEPGILYDGDHEGLCRVCFLIAIPAFAPTAHLPVLQHLAAFAIDEPRVDKLLTAKTPALAAKQIVTFKPVAVHAGA